MLVFANFEPLDGGAFDVMNPNTQEVFSTLKLVEVRKLSRPHPGREEPFSLLFEGPSEPPLIQGTYLLRHETLGEQAIFIVPVGEADGKRTYQSIFN